MSNDARDEVCPGCGALFTCRELGNPAYDHRHTRRCTVRYSYESCAWRWPYPFALRCAFSTGFNALEVWARYAPHRSLMFERRHAGGVHRIACEARARYMDGVRR